MVYFHIPAFSVCLSVWLAAGLIGGSGGAAAGGVVIFFQWILSRCRRFVA